MIVIIPKEYRDKITYGPGCVKAKPGVVLTSEEEKYLKELNQTMKEEGR